MIRILGALLFSWLVCSGVSILGDWMGLNLFYYACSLGLFLCALHGDD